jgi:hypothetical protein
MQQVRCNVITGAAGVYTMMQKLAYKTRLTYQADANRGCHTLLTDDTGLCYEYIRKVDMQT